MNIPDAPPALAPLLRRLYAEASTEITQHEHTPAPDEWYAGRVIDGYGGGDLGPFPSAEDALIAMVRYLWRELDEARAERDALGTELAELRRQARDAAAVALRLAEREGQGRAE